MSRKIRLLMGGSPCTHWSIAQKNNRETEPEGLGWELFKNYLIAKEKFKSDYFLYENNKSMAKPIRNQIDIEFNRTYAENTNWELVSTVEEGKGHTKRWLWRNKTTSKTEHITRILINSALVSAQNRQRYYWSNIPNVSQPEDRGILLKDTLETTTNEKSYALTASYNGAVAWNTIERKQRTMIVEPIRIGNSGSSSQAHRVYSSYGKSVTINAGGGGQGGKTGLYACPIEVEELDTEYYHGDKNTDVFGKIICKNTSDNKGQPAQGTRIYRTDRKSICLDGDSRKYIIDNYNPKFISTNKEMTIYEVRNGLITIKDKQYPIKLPDGYYIIRKLTVLECCRLQTFPDNYFIKADGTILVSNAQAYKQLGNSWTVEVIKHLLSHIPNLQDCDIEVLSMYDGISAGQLALERLGANVITYKATEIDKYCITTTQYHYPKTIQLGDAFQVKENDWRF